MGVLLLGALCLPGAGAAVQQAPAATSVAQSDAALVAHTLDARALGVTEAVLDYCATNDPVGAAKVRARLKRLTQGTSLQAQAQARGSREYRSAHDAEVDFVGKVDPHNAHRICSKAAAPNR